MCAMACLLARVGKHVCARVRVHACVYACCMPVSCRRNLKNRGTGPGQGQEARGYAEASHSPVRLRRHPSGCSLHRGTQLSVRMQRHPAHAHTQSHVPCTHRDARLVRM